MCFRGPHCFQGYWKDEANTNDTIDSQGWIHSGDVGVWTEQGTLRLVDRKKNIFKLAQGEYIAPEKIEGIYMQCSTVAQVYVHGDSLETCCVAIVVPDEEVVRALAGHKGIEEKTWEGICANDEIKQFIMKEMLAKGAENKLNKLEQVSCAAVNSLLLLDYLLNVAASVSSKVRPGLSSCFSLTAFVAFCTSVKDSKPSDFFGCWFGATPPPVFCSV